MAIMQYETIIVRKGDGIGRITLNRPAKMNAISTQMAREIMIACDELEDDPTLKCVVIDGAGRAFCAGGDMKEAMLLEAAASETLWDAVALWNKMGLRIKSMELPTIALLHGHVLGGGFLLAVCCDIRIAADDTELAVLLTKPRTFNGREVVGSAADMGLTWILPRLIGAGRAAELMFTGEAIDPMEAERIGLLNHVVPRAMLSAKGEELATKLAKGSRLGLRVTKRALHLSTYDRLGTHMSFEAAAQAHMVRAGSE